MRKKRFLAVIMAASMVLGSSVTSFAASVSSQDITSSPAKGTATGTAIFEGALNEDVFIVEVPTVAAPTDKTFDFIMDPQNLIERTQGAKYATTNTNRDHTNGISTDNIDYATLYFANRDTNGTVSQLSASSNYLSVKNKSTMDVAVGLTATVANMGNVAMSSNDQVSGNAEPSIYLAMEGIDTDGNNAQQEAITVSGASMSARVSGCDADYIVSLNSANEYEYTLSSNTVSFSGYDFRLTGATGGGQYADWAAVEKAMAKTAPKVTVTWNIVPYVDPVAPSIVGSTSFTKPADGTGITMNIDLGAGQAAAKGIKAITFPDPTDGSKTNTLVADNYEFLNGVLKIKGMHVSKLTANRRYTIIFDDAAATTVTFDITV